MNAPRSFLCGLGLSVLLGVAGYYLALAEPLAAVERDERTLATLQQNLNDARAIARAQGQLQTLNQRLRRATGTVSEGAARQTFAAALSQLTATLAAAGGTVSGIYPQEGRAACGVRLLVAPEDAVALMQQVEQSLVWHCERCEVQRNADAQLEIHLLLEHTR